MPRPAGGACLLPPDLRVVAVILPQADPDRVFRVRALGREVSKIRVSETNGLKDEYSNFLFFFLPFFCCRIRLR